MKSSCWWFYLILTAVLLLPATSAASERRWTGTTCMAGTVLDSPKLRANCQKGNVARHYCQLLEAGPGVCGQHAAGKWSVPMTAAELASEVERVRAAGSGGCGAAVYGRPINTSAELSFDAAKRLSSGLCTDFSYMGPTAAAGILREVALSRRSSGVQGILFTGDSMMRQLFLGIISTIRGTKVTAEHYFHTDALYILREGGDEIVVLTAEAKRAQTKVLQTFFPGYLSATAGTQSQEGPSLRGILAVVLYLWDIKPSSFRREALRIERPSLHVASFMYWWNNKGTLGEFDGYAKAVEQRQALAAPTTFVYVTTPWTAPGTFGGVESTMREPRNARVGAWAPSLPRGHVLDYAAIAASTAAIPKTKDGIHYGCIWTPKVPDTVTGQKDNGGGCTDPMNTAVAQWLLHLLLHLPL